MPDWSARKQLLESRLMELDNNLHKIEDRLDEPHSKRFEDFATETEDTEVLESLGNAGLKEIAMIKAALKRIKNDTYGICQQCDENILTERLETLPYTPLCKDCARKN
ncbi:MAG: TraR/DksA family transcriptional regulator [Hyphomicrobiales bacterium]|nr:TraR/DksA family transcriptional regulator [Hyphomicrobiales bacterium]